MEIYTDLETAVCLFVFKYCIQASSSLKVEEISLKVRSEKKAMLHAQLVNPDLV